MGHPHSFRRTVTTLVDLFDPRYQLYPGDETVVGDRSNHPVRRTVARP